MFTEGDSMQDLASLNRRIEQDALTDCIEHLGEVRENLDKALGYIRELREQVYGEELEASKEILWMNRN